MAKKSGKSGINEPDELEKILEQAYEDMNTNYDELPVSKPVNKKSKEELEIKLPTLVILRSKYFMKYQRDFVKALLPKPSYTITEAKAILNDYFGKDGE